MSNDRITVGLFRETQSGPPEQGSQSEHGPKTSSTALESGYDDLQTL